MELKSKQSDVSLSPSVSEQLPQLVILELNFIIYNDTLKEAEYYNFQKTCTTFDLEFSLDIVGSLLSDVKSQLTRELI